MPTSKNKLLNITLIVVIAFLAVVFALVLVFSLKNTSDLKNILQDSVKTEALSIAFAAREMIDIEAFKSYDSIEDVDADRANYNAVLTSLRGLQSNTHSEYIYALKQINGRYLFVFDTDTEDEAIFTAYDLNEVHRAAFVGREASGIMNVEDEWGTYNTAAIPIYDKDGTILGVVCADISDSFIRRSNDSSRTNAILLISTMAVTMSVMIVAILLLLKRVNAMQAKLYRMANYDVVTGLPNRQYLLDYLSRLSVRANKTGTPFALMFIDLDNFKKVNDGAGHDAGDELLRGIAEYIENVNENSKAFRPAAGMLNISARIGGDEFLSVLSGISTETEAAEAAQKLLDNFHSAAFDRFIEKFNVGLSIGVALYPYHSTNFNVLIKYADTAMYYAKRSEKHSYRIYDDEMGKIPLEELQATTNENR